MSDYDRLQLKLEAMEFSGAPVAVLINDARLAKILGVRVRKVFNASELKRSSPNDIKNNIENDELVSLESLYSDEEIYGSLAIGVDKDKTLTLAVLDWAIGVLKRGGELLLVGEKRLGVQSYEKYLAERMEGIAKMPMKDLGRLSFWRKNNDVEVKKEKIWKKNKVRVGFFEVELFSLPGVFASGELDGGSRLLIETIESQNLLPKEGKLLDLACGGGIIGAWAKKESPNLKVTLTDDNMNAFVSAKKTFEENKLLAEGIFCADGIEGVLEKDKEKNKNEKFDLITLNPPFHQGQRVDYSTAERLIAESLKILSPGGSIVLVANRFCPYERVLERTFGKFAMLKETTSFKVLRAVKG